MAATEAQRECIENTFGVTSAVVAGAGSGKTETLTNRVVYALQHPEASGVDDIDQILAITYTNKAAAELKSRIKAALERAATPENGLARQALKVDGAWISTIHGMCSRILKENAFTFGVDPAFAIMSDEVRVQLLDASIEQVIQQPGEQLGLEAAALFEEYRRSQVKDMLASLVGMLSESADDAQGALVLPPAANAVDCLLVMTSCTQELMLRFEEQGAGSKKGLTATARKYCDAGEAAIREVLGLGASEDCAAATVSAERLRQLREAPGSELLRLADLFPKLRTDAKVLREPLEATGADGLESLAGCALSILLSVGSRHLETLVQLARCAKGQFDMRKRLQGYLDNDDLLALVAHALGDARNASVAHRYAEQFRLVMVDEFQDTNQMQVDMINLVAGGSADVPSPKLCVVGDAQQSIYRFRNADLAVFQNHVGSVFDAPDGKLISLGDNFRSHSEILAFSKGVFSGVFEDSYLDLLHGRDEGRAHAEAPFFGAAPDEADASIPRRVNVKVFGAKGQENVSGRMAASIASDLKALADRGNRPGEMAVLLGVMSHAEQYAEALQQVGLKCAITGGTVFRNSPEAKLLVKLCYALADMRDTEALAAVLTSDLFLLSADDLMLLLQEGEGRAGAISALFARCTRGGDVPAGASAQLASALHVLSDAARKVGSRKMSSILEDVLVDSGWLHRLGEDAQVRAGNAFKAIRMVRDIESESPVGPLRLARQFEARVGELKEAPGVLSAEGDDFVRIMTIHASKGLSIPIVAVADAEFSLRDTAKLKSVSVEGKTYLALGADASLVGLEERGIVRSGAELLAKRSTALATQMGATSVLQGAGRQQAAWAPALFYQAIRKLNEVGDIEEHQRKLYVAYTRAKDALIVALRKFPKKPSHTREGGAPDAPHAIADLLFGDGGEDLFTSASEPVVQLVELHSAYAGKPEYDIDWKLRFEVVPAPGDDEAQDAAGDVSAGEVGAGAAALLSGAEGPRDAVLQVGAGASPEAGGLALEGEVPNDALQERDFIIPDARFEFALCDEPYRAQWAEGIFSASSLKGAAAQKEFQDGAADDAPPEPESSLPGEEPLVVTFDEDEPPAPATERGTAFHALCEWAARRWRPGEGLAVPPAERIAAIARLFGLNERQTRELPGMLSRWFSSPQAQHAARHAHVVPEQPFWVKVADGNGGSAARPLVMQGFIDLLAYDELGRGEVYVIDYKTGTFLDTDAKRRAAYGIQAQCYAHALLAQGFEEVRLDFFFVDQPDAPVTSFPAEGEPPYTIGSLREALLAALG